MKPDISDSKIQAIYNDLSMMHLELDPDPLQFGPKRLNEKVAVCRGHLTRCEKIFLQVSQDLHWYKREQRKSQTEFEIRMQDMMANDPEVMAGRNVKDREAIASNKLSGLRDVINELQVSVEDLDHLLVLVKAKRSDLRDLQGRIRDQLKICQEEVGLGARWGRKNTPSTINPTGGTIEIFDSLLESKISEIEAEETQAGPCETLDVDTFLEEIPEDIFSSL